MTYRRLKFMLGCGLAALVFASPHAADAATILNYDLSGAPSSGTLPDTWAPTTEAAGVTGLELTRGAGIVAAGLANGFSSSGWAAADASRQNAIDASEYYQWGFTVDPGYTANLDTLDFSLRRSAVAAPMNYEVVASLDGFATPGTTVATFQYLGRSSGTAPGTVTPGQWMTTDTPGQNNGNPIDTIDLSGISLLQNLPAGSTVSFRLYAWGAGGGADTNTVALGRVEGPRLGGDVTPIPEPSAAALLGLAIAGAITTGRRR